LLYAQFEDVDLQTMIVDPFGLDYTCAYLYIATKGGKEETCMGLWQQGRIKLR
jgi:hypothetical protein